MPIEKQFVHSDRLVSAGRDHRLSVEELVVVKQCIEYYENYNSLRIFRPRTFYGFLVEDEAISAEVVANSVMYKNEFVLSKNNRNKVARNNIDLEEYQRFSTTLCSTVEESLKELNIGGF